MEVREVIHFSCADFSFPVLSHDKVLALLELMDFKFVDIGLFTDRSHLQPADQLDHPEIRGEALRKRTKSHGLEISDVFLQSSLDCKEFAINQVNSKIRESERERFKRLVDYTVAANCRHITGLPGVRFDENSDRICVEELAWRLELSESLGIKYSVEPHFGSIMENPQHAVKLLSTLPGISITLDHSHYTAQGFGIDLIRPLAAFASHVHARGAAKGEMQTSLARNKTDFKAVVTHLLEANYHGAICLEYCYIDWENCNRTDNISETLLLRERLSALLNT